MRIARFVLVSVAVLSLAACGSSTSAQRITTSTSAVTTSSSTASTQAVPRCTADELTFVLGANVLAKNSSNEFTVPLYFTNSAKVVCSLQGFPELTLAGPLNAAAHSYAEKHRRGVADPLVLAPNQTATAALTYVQPTAAQALCTNGAVWTPATITATVPGDTASSLVAWTGGPFDDCDAASANPSDYLTPLSQ